MRDRGTPRGEQVRARLVQLVPQRYREWRVSPYRHNLAVADATHVLRTSARFVAVACLLLSLSSLLLLVTPGGPTSGPQQVATTLVASSSAAAALLWWRRGWPRERTSYLFVVAIEVGHGVVLASCADPVVALLAATWFFLIGDYLAFAHGRTGLVAHCAWVMVNLLIYGVRALVEPGADVPFVVFLEIALTATLIVTRLFAQLFADSIRSSSERSAELAHRDPLTKLLNRRGLEAAAPRIFGQARAEDHVVAVLLIDIDRFKRVNDAHGHQVGDTVLSLLAARLTQTVRKSGLVARIGGEEFVVLDRVHRDGIKPMAERLRAACRHDEDAVPISVSIGAIGLAPSDFPTNDPRQLLTNLIIRADGAMYSAKVRGGDQVVLELPPPAALRPAIGGMPSDPPAVPYQRSAEMIFDRVIEQRSQGGKHHDS